MSQVFTSVQYSMLGMLFFGDSVFNAIGMNPPRGLYEQAKQNKAWSAFLVFMLGNQINAGLITTGAFEVEHGYLAQRCIQNNKLVCKDIVQSDIVFSKLQEGQFPNPDHVVQTIASFDHQHERSDDEDD